MADLTEKIKNAQVEKKKIYNELKHEYNENEAQ
jgi:hypothetical protein